MSFFKQIAVGVLAGGRKSGVAGIKTLDSGGAASVRSWDPLIRDLKTLKNEMSNMPAGELSDERYLAEIRVRFSRLSHYKCLRKDLNFVLSSGSVREYARYYRDVGIGQLIFCAERLKKKLSLNDIENHGILFCVKFKDADPTHCLTRSAKHGAGYRTVVPFSRRRAFSGKSVFKQKSVLAGLSRLKDEPIGKGSYSAVHSVGPAQTDQYGSSEWAFKKFKREVSFKNFLNEIKALNDCGGTSGIVKLEGAVVYQSLKHGCLRYGYIMPMYHPWNAEVLPFLQENTDNRVRSIFQMVGDILPILHSLHSLGVVHGDLKETNIVLDSVGKPVLVDFGLSGNVGQVSKKTRAEYADFQRVLGGTCPDVRKFAGFKTRDGHVHPPYTDYDPAFDIFALGCMVLKYLGTPYQSIGLSNSLWDVFTWVSVPDFLSDNRYEPVSKYCLGIIGLMKRQYPLLFQLDEIPECKELEWNDYLVAVAECMDHLIPKMEEKAKALIRHFAFYVRCQHVPSTVDIGKNKVAWQAQLCDVLGKAEDESFVLSLDLDIQINPMFLLLFEQLRKLTPSIRKIVCDLIRHLTAVDEYHPEHCPNGRMNSKQLMEWLPSVLPAVESGPISVSAPVSGPDSGLGLPSGSTFSMTSESSTCVSVSIARSEKSGKSDDASS